MAETKNAICTYDVNGEQVKLSPAIVRDYLVSGDPQSVTMQEVVMFINLCKFQKLNPFLKEAYLVKYGKSSPATLIVGKGAFEKRAAANPKYKGFEAGILVQLQDGKIDKRTGTFYLPGERLVGGWCIVYVDGYQEPVKAMVSLQEYSTGKSLWASKPATMIRKVAKVQALREAFPEDFQGMYVQEEMGVDTALDEIPVGSPMQAPAPESMPTPEIMPEPEPIPVEAEEMPDFNDIMEE
jgi:phage recombination protein Bet